jgi:PAS domain S-box-containing protein
MKGLEGVALDQTLERAGDGVFVIGTDGKVVLWNRAAERIMGYTAREVIGRACCDVFAGRDDKDNRLCFQGCHVQSLVNMGDPVQNFDMRTRNKAGQIIWVNVSVLVVPNGRPTTGMVVHMIRDVTASKELLTMVHERLAAASGHTNGTPVEASLTRRELEVLRLVAEGVRTKEAASRLHVSPATIRNHVQNILSRLGVHSRLEAVAYAHRHRLL